jgi:hypothetical protein
MTPCIGWHADPPCPVYGDFHGCRHPDRHGGNTGGAKVHECLCGATTRATRSKKDA